MPPPMDIPVAAARETSTSGRPARASRIVETSFAVLAMELWWTQIGVLDAQVRQALAPEDARHRPLAVEVGVDGEGERAFPPRVSDVEQHCCLPAPVGLGLDRESMIRDRFHLGQQCVALPVDGLPVQLGGDLDHARRCRLHADLSPGRHEAFGCEPVEGLGQQRAQGLLGGRRLHRYGLFALSLESLEFRKLVVQSEQRVFEEGGQILPDFKQ